MKRTILTFLLILLSVIMIIPAIGCQSASPAPAPVAQAKPPAPVPPSPAPAPVTPAQPAVQPAPPVSAPQPPPALQVAVSIEFDKPAIPTGIIFNIKYSVNRSANLTMSSTLPDGSDSGIVYFFKKETDIAGSYLLPVRSDIPIGERVITLKAEGIDGQTATATCKYWAGSVVGNLDIP
jgi:hypothetical protein